MFELIHLLTLLVGVFSGVIGGISGAGGGLIVSPYMILIGLPPSVAVSTPKLAGIGVGTGSLIRFFKSGSIDWYWAKRLLLVTVIFGTLGSYALIWLPESFIKIFALGLSVVIVLQFIGSKNIGLKRVEPTRNRRIAGYVVYSIVETIRGAIGSGIGTINMMVMMSNFGLPAINASATKRFVTYPALLTGLIILGVNGFIDWRHGLMLLLGTGVGGYFGAILAIDKGNLFVRRILVFVVMALVLSVIAL